MRTLTDDGDEKSRYEIQENVNSQTKGIAYAQYTARGARRLRTKISIEQYSFAFVLNNSMAQRPCVIVLYDRKIELSLHNH
jgi:hypothetical protein